MWATSHGGAVEVEGHGHQVGDARLVVDDQDAAVGHVSAAGSAGAHAPHSGWRHLEGFLRIAGAGRAVMPRRCRQPPRRVARHRGGPGPDGRCTARPRAAGAGRPPRRPAAGRPGRRWPGPARSPRHRRGPRRGWRRGPPARRRGRHRPPRRRPGGQVGRQAVADVDGGGRAGQARDLPLVEPAPPAGGGPGPRRRPTDRRPGRRRSRRSPAAEAPRGPVTSSASPGAAPDRSSGPGTTGPCRDPRRPPTPRGRATPTGRRRPPLPRPRPPPRRRRPQRLEVGAGGGGHREDQVVGAGPHGGQVGDGDHHRLVAHVVGGAEEVSAWTPPTTRSVARSRGAAAALADHRGVVADPHLAGRRVAT